jgi:hypothetical protein
MNMQIVVPSTYVCSYLQPQHSNVAISKLEAEVNGLKFDTD